jgi:hypothetical protein
LQEKVPAVLTSKDKTEEDLGFGYATARVDRTVNEALHIMNAVVSEHVNTCT